MRIAGLVCGMIWAIGSTVVVVTQPFDVKFFLVNMGLLGITWMWQRRDDS